jgi:hypothetical protein
MSAAEVEFQELMRDKSHRTRHPEDDSDNPSTFRNHSDDEDAHKSRRSTVAEPRASVSLARNTIPSTRYGANTGPKGVISDAQDWRDSRRKERSSVTLQRYGGGRQRSEEPTLTQKVDEEDEDDDLEEDEADEGFMEKWRKSRLQELTNGGQRTSTLHQNSQRRAMYGDMKAVDGEGYLDAVERSAPDTVVVVYIYDEYVSLMSTAGYGYVC